MSDDIVKFLMPDGTKVSNDPRFDQEEALAKAFAARENVGHVGVDDDEMEAQTQVLHAASLNSGQPGVGENAVPDDPTKDLHGPLGSPAQQRQVDDRNQAQAEGGSPQGTTVEDAEPVDSNAAVAEVRKLKKERSEALAKATEKLGEDGPGDPEKPLSEWTGPQLKAEVARRNAEEDRAEEDQLSIKGLKKKSEIVDLLNADDARRADNTEE